MQRVIIVGGGIIGMLHAWEARSRNLEVLQLDTDTAPRDASLRNLGLIWVTGRAAGPDLELALRGRALWEDIAAQVTGVGFRPDGGMTVLYSETETQIAREVIQGDQSQHEFALLTAAESRERNPALRGVFHSALFCPMDAVLEPSTTIPALRKALEGPGYRWLGGRTATEVGTGYVRDHTGERHVADYVILCTGASVDGVAAELAAGLPLRRVQLQILQTESLGERLTTCLSDSLSFRYYPVYKSPGLGRMPPVPDLVAAYGVKLMVVQRASGELTIGDSHVYHEPFDFASNEAIYDFLLNRAAALFGRQTPPVVRRWMGTYCQPVNDELILRREVCPGVVLVTGAGGRGMGAAPAIAEDTFAKLLSEVTRPPPGPTANPRLPLDI